MTEYNVEIKLTKRAKVDSDSSGSAMIRALGKYFREIVPSEPGEGILNVLGDDDFRTKTLPSLVKDMDLSIDVERIEE